jgi:ketosteroid isomerase-like protein
MTLKMVYVFLVISGAFGISTQTRTHGTPLMENSTNVRQRMSSQSSEDEVKKVIVELDRAYQEAVKNNDVKTMARILADDFVLVTGKGKVFSKEDLLKEAREGKTIYERQEDSEQIVRVWGDTAVITALLWVKGTSAGKSFEYRLWFSDVYKRTPNGWHYVFAQAAQPLAKEP